MKVQESFVVAEPPEKLWEFFEQVDQVAACVPGVDTVEAVDDDNLKVRVTQAVGPMRATFDLRMRITERREGELIQFQAVGRAVRGAAGNVRTTNTVRLAPTDGGTRVELEGDLAMGGVLGSVGQKVIAKQVAQVTKDFSAALERALKGEPALAPAAPAKAKAAPAKAAVAKAAPAPSAGAAPAEAAAAPATGAAPAQAAAAPAAPVVPEPAADAPVGGGVPVTAPPVAHPSPVGAALGDPRVKVGVAAAAVALLGLVLRAFVRRSR
jgi:carbon monoxide dehydrogenase subunit G